VKDEPLCRRPGAAAGRRGGSARGLLIHDYTYDDQFRITGANLIIPTTMNMANIEFDMRALVPQLMAEGTPNKGGAGPGDADAGLRSLHLVFCSHA